MSKYDFDTGYSGNSTPVLIPGEQVLWSGKPKKNAFIINKIVGLMPIALIWLALDGFIIYNAMSAMSRNMMFMIPFFALHLMPVWLWLSNVLTANRRWKNTMYYVTDRRILIQSGFIGQELQTVYYKEIRNVNLKFGLIDRLLHVGDIHFDLGQYQYQGKTRVNSRVFLDIAEPQALYTRIQKIILDMQADMEFPNAYRPEANPGYNTRYEG